MTPSDEWATPGDLYSFFSGWDDPALPGRTDGLTRDWGDPTYCNPPYSNPLPWVRKAIEEAGKGKRVALLLRHDSSTEWWRLLHEASAYFLAVIGRLHFNDAGAANFASVLVILPAALAGEEKHRPNPVCVYPDWEGGYIEGQHEWGKDGTCCICGEEK